MNSKFIQGLLIALGWIGGFIVTGIVLGILGIAIGEVSIFLFT